MKKYLSVLLAASMLLGILTACASQQKTPNQPNQTDPGTVNASSASEPAGPTTNFPEKAIRMIVPYSTGGGNDLTARIVADALSKELPQPVVVENMPGASGEVGWTECYNADPDGYTLTIVATPATILNPLAGEVGYDYEKFEYLMAVCHDPRLIVVSSSSDIYTLDDLLEYAKTNRVVVGDSGATGFGHYSGVDFVDQVGIENFTFVPFDGTGDQMIAVASGDCTIGVPGASEAKAMFTAGQVRPLCVMWGERIPDYPDVPTTAELGYPDLVHTSTRGFVTSPGTPQEVIDVLVSALEKAVERDDYKEGEQSIGVTRNIITGEEFKQQMDNAYSNYARIVELEKSWG